MMNKIALLNDAFRTTFSGGKVIVGTNSFQLGEPSNAG
jgi:hypothetical protein